ncbi:MAG: Yip1 family protein [Draconibacterium sp.]
MEFSFSNLVSQIKELLFTPKVFWQKQKDRAESSSKLWLTYMLPILLAVAVAAFIGEFFRRTDFFIEYPVLKAIRELLLFILIYFLGVFFTTELMKTFGGEKDVATARKLVVYSMTPVLLVSLLTGMFPFLYILDILGVYSFYLFWVGARELLTFPDNKESSYVLITIVVNFFVFSFLSVLLSKLLNAYY